MPKAVSLALLVIGILLLVLSAVSADSVSSYFSEIFQGTPDTRTIVLLLGGLFATIVGGIGLFRGMGPSAKAR